MAYIKIHTNFPKLISAFLAVYPPRCTLRQPDVLQPNTQLTVYAHEISFAIAHDHCSANCETSNSLPLLLLPHVRV